jgi:hypothetical protein
VFRLWQEVPACTSNPVSLPIVPPQPEKEVYGFVELALFQTYTRETYRAAFGVQAPAWNPSRPPKFWFDSSADASAAGNVAAYRIFAVNSTGTWALQQFVLPAAEAVAINLPGSVTYPPYVIAPTGATRGGSAQAENARQYFLKISISEKKDTPCKFRQLRSGWKPGPSTD